MARLFIYWFTLIAYRGAPSGEASSERRLTLVSNSISAGDKNVVAAVGDTVELHCNFVVDGWSTVQWLKFQKGDGATPVPLPADVISSIGELRIATLRHVNESDEGNYSCVLTSLSSGAKSYMFEIGIKDELSCNRSSCSSHGVCRETLNGYTCQCLSGFIGHDCEFKDPCADSPCINGGTCTAQDEDFTCNCVRGYGGVNCSSEVCLPNICGSGGTCSVKERMVHCECSNNYAGNRCQHRCNMDISGRYDRYGHYNHNYNPYCSQYTCKIASSNSFRSRETCVCDNSRPTSGNRCIMESDVRNECFDSNICNGHGSCVDYVFGYRCDCHSYYHGTHCEFYNECGRSDNLCIRYGGTCVDLTDGYKCRNCPAGQHGDKCQYKKDPCKVTCSSSSMTAECDTRFLSDKMRTIPIYLLSKIDSCRMPLVNRYNSNRYLRRLTISYSNCGTKTDYSEESVSYRNYLSVGMSEKIWEDSDSIVTRELGHFSFKMECTLPLVRNSSAAALSDLSLALNETKDLEDHKAIDVTSTTIELYKSNYHTRISNYVVGDRLYAKVTIDANSNPTLRLGYKLYLVSCFATPYRISTNATIAERYDLLRDGCIKDDSFQFEKQPKERTSAYFSFDSFSFKANPGKLYLHCTSLACVESARKERCGVNCDAESQTTPLPSNPKDKVVTKNGTLITREPGSSVTVNPLAMRSAEKEMGQ